MNRPKGKTTGREVINSCNFKNVTIEPVNEIEPMTTVKTVANKATKLKTIKFTMNIGTKVVDKENA